MQFLATGAAAPTFDLPTPDGGRVSLASLLASHKAVLLNFTFGQCSACLLEIPALKNLHNELKDKGLAIIAININDDKAQAAQFLAKYQIPYLMGLDSAKGGGKEEASNGYHVDLGGTNYLIGAGRQGAVALCGYE